MQIERCFAAILVRGQRCCYAAAFAAICLLLACAQSCSKSRAAEENGFSLCAMRPRNALSVNLRILRAFERRGEDILGLALPFARADQERKLHDWPAHRSSIDAVTAARRIIHFGPLAAASVGVGQPWIGCKQGSHHCSLSSTPSTRREAKMSFFFRNKRAPRGPPPAHCKTCKQRLDACACAPTEDSYEERRARAPRPKSNWSGRSAPAAPEPAPADAADDGGCEDATPRLDAAAERRLELVYAAYVDDAARANAGARLQESDAPPISCFGEDAFCMAHGDRGSVASGVVDYQSMATRNRLDVGPLALTPPKKPSPGLEGRYRSLAPIDTGPAPAPAARSPGLDLYLESRGLGAYASRIRALGARKVADLQLLSDEDIDDLGVPKELRVVLKVSLS